MPIEASVDTHVGDMLVEGTSDKAKVNRQIRVIDALQPAGRRAAKQSHPPTRLDHPADHSFLLGQPSPRKTALHFPCIHPPFAARYGVVQTLASEKPCRRRMHTQDLGPRSQLH